MLNLKVAKLLALTALVVLGLMTFSSNPLVDFACTDSAVFSYIGSAMHKGVVPYRDVFDHKGLLIYVINWLGSFLGPSLIGVWIIEVIFCLLSFIFIWQFALHYFGKDVAFISVFPYASLFTYGNNAGNFTETYAHLFIVIVLLWILKHAKEGTRFSASESFLSGGCFAAILFLRPNMGAIGIVAAVYFIEQAFRDHDVKGFALNSLLVLSGLVCFSAPLLGYLVLNGALQSCWECYIEYNLKYASGTACHSSYMRIVYVLAAGGLLTCFSKPWRRSAAYNMVFLVLTTLVLAMNSQYKHYLLMVVPGVILPFMLGIARLRELNFHKVVFAATVLVSILFITKESSQSNLDIGGYLAHVKKTHRVQDIADFKEGAAYSTLYKLTSLIDQKDSVLVVGNECELYRRLGLMPSGYYAYIPDSYDDITDERIREEVRLGKNAYAITNARYFNEKRRAVLEGSYEQIADAGTYILWKAKMR